MLLPWQQSWLQSLSALNQILPFVTLQQKKEGPIANIHSAHIVLSFLINHEEVDDVC